MYTGSALCVVKGINQVNVYILQCQFSVLFEENLVKVISKEFKYSILKNEIRSTVLQDILYAKKKIFPQHTYSQHDCLICLTQNKYINSTVMLPCVHPPHSSVCSGPI